MAVSLLGLMAVAMFYIVTVVVGLCANRCLSREAQSEDESEQTKSTAIKREKSTEQELMRLAEPPPGTSTYAAGAASNACHTGGPSTVPYELSEHDVDVRSTGSALGPRSRPNSVIVQEPEPQVQKLAGRSDSKSKEIKSSVNASTVLIAGAAETPEQRRRTSTTTSDERGAFAAALALPMAGKFLIAERNVGVIIGSLSLLVIKTGGIYSSSATEQVYSQGLLWCQLPIAASLSLLLGGALFAGQMRAEGYISIMDPFQEMYGKRVGIFLSIPVMVAEILVGAAVLASLSVIVELVLGIEQHYVSSVSIISILCYLTFGGFYAVTFTDAVQFVYLCVGLWLFWPFAVLKATRSVSNSLPEWLGEVDGNKAGLFVDQLSMLILGGIPFQSYFQRVLATKQIRGISVITVVGSVGCIINAVPAIMIGAAAASSDWSNFTDPAIDLTQERASLVLHYSLSYLVPKGIAFLAVGALVSGLLAAADSSIFAAASLFAHNCYACWLRPQAKERELLWACRLAMLVACSAILGLCLAQLHIYHYWISSYDILYVLTFPQLFCVLYFRYANTYGAVAGTVSGALVRVLVGEQKLGVPALLRLPFHSPQFGQLFPYRTLAMLVNLVVTIVVSFFYHWLRSHGLLTSTKDVFVCFTPIRSRKLDRRKEMRRSSNERRSESVERMTVV